MQLSNTLYTSAVQQVLTLAQQQASARHSTQVEPEHVLLGLLNSKGNAALPILAALHIDLPQLRQTVEAHLPTAHDNASSTLPLSAATERVLADALKEAHHLGHAQASPAHLLLGLLYTEQGTAQAALARAGVTLYDTRQHLLATTGRQPVKSHLPSLATDIRPSAAFITLVVLLVGSGIGLMFAGGTMFVSALTVIFILSGWIASVCIHEFGHALAAYLGGDLSVRDSGYLTLDPARYTHPIFSILMPLLFLLLGGLGLPGGAVYINRRALRNRTWESIVSAAGPLGTALFGLLIIAPFSLFFDITTITAQSIPFWSALAFLGFLQITALLFNLIPIPPLDGFGIAAPFLPDEIADMIYRYSQLLFLLFLMMMWQDTPISAGFWEQAFTLVDATGIPLYLVGYGIDAFMFWQQ